LHQLPKLNLLRPSNLTAIKLPAIVIFLINPQRKPIPNFLINLNYKFPLPSPPIIIFPNPFDKSTPIIHQLKSTPSIKKFRPQSLVLLRALEKHVKINFRKNRPALPFKQTSVIYPHLNNIKIPWPISTHKTDLPMNKIISTWGKTSKLKAMFYHN
jgi:hypothetical protein